MAAYIIVRVHIANPEAYQEYMKHTPRIIADHGGKMIARGGTVETLEGPEETKRLVIIEFPSMDVAKTFYHSEDYQKCKTLRQGAGEAQFFVVDGYATEEWQAALATSSALSFY